MPYKKGTDVQLTGDMDMQQHQLLNPVISNLASNPLKPKSGQIYFNTVTNKKRTFNGTTWDEDGTGGGPGTSTYVPAFFSYFNFFTTQKVGYGSAIATVLMIILSILAVGMFRFQNRRGADL